MSTFTIHSFSAKTKKVKFSVNDSEEVITLTLDDPEAESPRKIMEILKAYATDGGVRPLKTEIENLPIKETIHCNSLI